MEKIQLSVVIGVRNRDESLKLCLASLAKQSLAKSRYEIIVVNYGGSKSTKSIIDSIKSKKITYIFVNETGLFNESRAKNIGIKKARGTYIISTNADIIYTENVLLGALNIFLNEKSHTLFQLNRFDLEPYARNSKLLTANESSYKKDNSTLGPDSAYGDFQATHRDMWEKLRGYDERMTGWGYMDIDLYRRAKNLGMKRIWLPHDRLKIYHIFHEERAKRMLTANTALSKINQSSWEKMINWGMVNKKIEICLVSKNIISNEIKNIIMNAAKVKFNRNSEIHFIEPYKNPHKEISMNNTHLIRARNVNDFYNKSYEFFRSGFYDYLIEIRASKIPKYFYANLMNNIDSNIDILIYNLSKLLIFDENISIFNSKAALLLFENKSYNNKLTIEQIRESANTYELKLKSNLIELLLTNHKK